MSTSTDKLIEISQSDWGTLRDLYLIDWPVNMIGFYTIDNYIRWKEKIPTIKNLSVYSLNGDWSDGTFAIVDHSHLYSNTLAESNKRLTSLLSLLDWSGMLVASTVRKKHRSAVLEVIESKKLMRFFDEETLLYYMPKEEIQNLKVSIPDKITVGKLTTTQVNYADSVWPQRHPASLSFLQRLSELNPNICLTTDAGKLVSWCFRLASGPLGALQVDDEFKRQGFGSLTVKLMAKELSLLGHDTFGCVVLKNFASHELFKKNGFEVIDSVFFIGIKQNEHNNN